MKISDLDEAIELLEKYNKLTRALEFWDSMNKRDKEAAINKTLVDNHFLYTEVYKLLNEHLPTIMITALVDYEISFKRIGVEL